MLHASPLLSASAHAPYRSAPRFGQRTAVVPDLKTAWHDPQARHEVTRVLENGILRQSPQLARAIISRIDQLCRTSAETDPYIDLNRLIHRPEHRHLFTSNYSQDESVRFERRFRQILDLLSGTPKPSRYLDIGCGTGYLTSRLAAHWQLEKENAVGLEVFARPSGEDNILYRLFDGKTIPYEDNTFDLASLLMVLHHADDPDRLIRESFRILRPGGHLIVREVDAPTESLRRFNDVMDHLYDRVFNGYDEVPAPADHIGATEWKDRFMNAGFIVQNTSRPEPDNPFRPVHFLLRKP